VTGCWLCGQEGWQCQIFRFGEIIDSAELYVDIDIYLMSGVWRREYADKIGWKWRMVKEECMIWPEAEILFRNQDCLKGRGQAQ
jgi:hypothetical protein